MGYGDDMGLCPRCKARQGEPCWLATTAYPRYFPHRERMSVAMSGPSAPATRPAVRVDGPDVGADGRITSSPPMTGLTAGEVAQDGVSSPLS